jgi:hypothetical protein
MLVISSANEITSIIIAALQAAPDSDIGIAAGDDAIAHASKRIHLRTEEHVIL